MEIKSRTFQTFFPNWMVVCKHISMYVIDETGESIQCNVCNIQYAITVIRLDET